MIIIISLEVLTWLVFAVLGGVVIFANATRLLALLFAVLGAGIWMIYVLIAFAKPTGTEKGVRRMWRCPYWALLLCWPLSGFSPGRREFIRRRFCGWARFCCLQPLPFLWGWASGLCCVRWGRAPVLRWP